MLILSFDVGIINLAYCIFETTTQKIKHWGIIDLKSNVPDLKSNVPEISFSARIPNGSSTIAKAANDIHITLIKSLDNLPFLLDVDYVVIEKQPSFNPKMRIIGGCLQSYFYIRGVIDKIQPRIVSIEFFSPKHKLKCYTGPELTIESKSKSKYVQTKKMGILIAQAKLQEFDETDEFKKLFQSSKKQDDLADSYLQAITFCLFRFNKFNPKNQNAKKQKEVKQTVLTQAQIKKQLKEYLDKHLVQELLQQPSDNQLQQVLQLMDPHLKQSIFTKFSINNFMDITFLERLSMKSYTRYFFKV